MNTALVNGFGNDIGQGASIAILAIIMVFAILLLIIVLSEVVGSLVNKTVKDEAVTETKEMVPSVETVRHQLDLADEDAVVAALVASIDYRRETNKNIQVLSVKEVR